MKPLKDGILQTEVAFYVDATKEQQPPIAAPSEPSTAAPATPAATTQFQVDSRGRIVYRYGYLKNMLRINIFFTNTSLCNGVYCEIMK